MQDFQEIELSSKADGMSLYSRYWRSPQASSSILFLHGLQGHIGWFAMADDLQKVGVNVLAVDRRGSGRSDGVRGHANSMAELIADIETAVEFLKGESPDMPIHAVASSYGALLALAYSKAHPEHFTSLIFLAPAIFTSDQLPSYSFAEKMSIAFKAWITKDQRTLYPALTSLEQLSSVPQKEDEIRQDPHIQTQFTASFLWITRALIDGAADSLNSLQVPLLVILGTQDPIVDNIQTREIIEGLSVKEKLVVEIEAGHVMDFEQGQRMQVVSIISRWINALLA